MEEIAKIRARFKPQPKMTVPGVTPVVTEVETPLFCENCGTKSEKDAFFCMECGTKVEK